MERQQYEHLPSAHTDGSTVLVASQALFTSSNPYQNSEGTNVYPGLREKVKRG